MSKILNISFKYNFLETLASFWLDKHSDHSNFQSSTIILPNMRSALILKDIFVDRLAKNKHNKSLFLPNILSIDKFTANDSFFCSTQLENITISPQPFRLLQLARLISAFIEKKNLFDKLDQAKIFQLATSLGDFLDKIIIDQIDMLDFKKHIKSIDNKHWQVSLQFLEEVIFKYWPKIVQEAGYIERNQLANIAVNNLIKKILSQSYLSSEFILAGTRGRRKSTEKLMQAIYKHKNSYVILNGFQYKKNCKITSPLYLQNRFVAKNNFPKIEEIVDRDNIISSDGRINAYLSSFDDDFYSPANNQSDGNNKKGEIAEDHWEKAEKINLGLAECSTSLEEAKLVATLTKSLLSEKKSVLIISQTKELSEMIIKFLDSSNIAYNYAQGINYSKCPLGQTLLKIAKMYSLLSTDKIKNTDYLAVINDPLSIFAKHKSFVNFYDRSLRTNSNFDESNSSATQNKSLNRLEKDQAKVDKTHQELLQKLNQLLMEIENEALSNQDANINGTTSLSSHLKNIHFFLTKLINENEVRKNDSSYNLINNYILELIENGQSTNIDREEVYSVLLVMLESNNIQPDYDIKSRVQILTNFEARFVVADAVIITSFEDGIWPEATEVGPWLPMRIQSKIGFEDIDLSSGQTAHNLLQYLNQKEAFITFAKVKKSKANLHSKWWLQLLQNDKLTIDDLDRHLSKVNKFFGVLSQSKVGFNKKPVVKAKVRDQQEYSFSPTSLTTLINSPFDYHIKYNLKLKEIPPYSPLTKNLLIGNIIHKVMEEFFNSDILANNDNKILSSFEIASILTQSFAEKFIDDSSILINNQYEQGFIKIADKIITNNHLNSQNYTEILGTWKTNIGQNEVAFKARADRICCDNNNSINIIDYKTGLVETITKLQAILELTMAQKKAFKINKHYDDLLFSFWQIDKKGNFKDSQVVLNDKTLEIVPKIKEIIEYLLSEDNYYHTTKKTHHKSLTRYHDWK